MSAGPRVFEEGAVTLVLAPSGASLWAGTHCVSMYGAVSVEVGEDRSVRAVVRFSRSHDAEVALRIEENVRLMRTVPWVEVLC
jgi:hypothetical protein